MLPSQAEGGIIDFYNTTSRIVWNTVSVSVVAIKKKLRRVSSVGSHFLLVSGHRSVTVSFVPFVF
jgi:hypothetical protein